jgi:hypothetical protein
MLYTCRRSTIVLYTVGSLNNEHLGMYKSFLEHPGTIELLVGQNAVGLPRNEASSWHYVLCPVVVVVD